MNDRSQAQAQRPVVTDERPLWLKLNTAGQTPSARTARRAAAKIAAQYRKAQQ